MKNDQVTVCIDSLLSLHGQERERKRENAERQWRISVSANIHTLSSKWLFSFVLASQMKAGLTATRWDQKIKNSKWRHLKHSHCWSGEVKGQTDEYILLKTKHLGSFYIKPT